MRPLVSQSARIAPRLNAGSPGLQLSFLESSSARRTASSIARLYFATRARASASVVGSGTVGPDAIADGSSCRTSEIASVTISAAWLPARASRPPLMRDKCLRTVLISPIGAPERNSARVTCCFCVNEMPSTGAIQFADPPPDSSTSRRSSAVASAARRSVSSAAFSPASSGAGWPASTTLIPPRRHAVAVTGGRNAGQARRVERQRIEIMPLRRRRHRRSALAGGEADHPPFGRGAEMRRQHDIGMRGSDGRVKDRTQEGVVGRSSGFTRASDFSDGRPVIHPIAAKKTRGQAAGVNVRSVMSRSDIPMASRQRRR